MKNNSHRVIGLRGSAGAGLKRTAIFKKLQPLNLMNE